MSFYSRYHQPLNGQFLLVESRKTKLYVFRSHNCFFTSCILANLETSSCSSGLNKITLTSDDYKKCENKYLQKLFFCIKGIRTRTKSSNKSSKGDYRSRRALGVKHAVKMLTTFHEYVRKN